MFHKLIVPLMLSMILASSLVACGQKGPLYIPQPPEEDQPV